MSTVRESVSDTRSSPQVDYATLPMAADRAARWATLRDIGPLVITNGWRQFAGVDDVLAALRDSEVYPSRKAFDDLGDPLPLVPNHAADHHLVVKLRAGSPVPLWLGAVNRNDSDAISVNEVEDGKVNRHWGFGGDPHRCLRFYLARLELNRTVNEWMRRVPDFEVAPGFTPQITSKTTTFGLSALPLRDATAKKRS